MSVSYETRSDLALLRRAIEERWHVPAEARTRIPQDLYELATDTEQDWPLRLDAMKILVRMHGQNKQGLPKLVMHEHEVSLAEQRRERIAAAIAGGIPDR